jgi:hypothetical protein
MEQCPPMVLDVVFLPWFPTEWLRLDRLPRQLLPCPFHLQFGVVDERNDRHRDFPHEKRMLEQSYCRQRN